MTASTTWKVRVRRGYMGCIFTPMQGRPCPLPSQLRGGDSIEVHAVFCGHHGIPTRFIHRLSTLL